jgi:hypothetical protein
MVGRSSARYRRFPREAEHVNEAVATIEPASTPRNSGAIDGAGARPCLSEPLPAEIFSGSDGLLTAYRAYAAFSAPWFWRRTAVFGPAGAALGLFQALILGLLFHDGRLGLFWAVVGVPIWLILVAGGPAFATMVRHRRWPPQTERVAIVAAILAGVAVSCLAQGAADVLSRATLGARLTATISGALEQRLQAPGAVLILVVWTARALIFACLGGGLALRTFFREQRLWQEARHARELAVLRRQKNDADLRLTVLQAQVEPHFLFNTLASIHSLIRKDPDRAEATMEALVAHLRATLPKFRADIGCADSTLDQQIDICESYLALMRVRMGNRLRFAIDVPPHLRRHPFPPLMLISLVENAIKHGIEPSAGGGNVIVSAEVENQAAGRRLVVSVIDDGVGLRAEVGGGMGLRNVRGQLSERFGGQGTLVVRGRAVRGVSAAIRLPYREPSA